MSTYNTLVSLFSIGVVLYCGLLIGDKNDLKDKINEQELTIVKLEDKVVEQQSEIKILVEDNTTKKIAIASLEERVQSSSKASQEVIDKLVELAKIEVDLHPAAAGDEQKSDQEIVESPASISKDQQISPTVEKKNSNVRTNVVNDDASKKFINLRNDIYSRYK